MIIVHCKNPACGKSFPLDAEHRHGGCCSEKCQQAMTPAQPTPNGSSPVQSAHLPHPGIQRKHGKDNRE